MQQIRGSAGVVQLSPRLPVHNWTDRAQNRLNVVPFFVGLRVPHFVQIGWVFRELFPKYWFYEPKVITTGWEPVLLYIIINIEIVLI